MYLPSPQSSLTIRVGKKESMYPLSDIASMEHEPMPDSIPPVPEIGATSAALKSASFFIAAKCQAYNDDFMMCRKEKWNTHGPGGCLKEGRKVTRCAISVYLPHLVLKCGIDGRIDELNRVCGDAYKVHYECLDKHNQQFKDCRPAERGLNACVLSRLVAAFLDLING